MTITTAPSRQLTPRLRDFFEATSISLRQGQPVQQLLPDAGSGLLLVRFRRQVAAGKLSRLGRRRLHSDVAGLLRLRHLELGPGLLLYAIQTGHRGHFQLQLLAPRLPVVSLLLQAVDVAVGAGGDGRLDQRDQGRGAYHQRGDDQQSWHTGRAEDLREKVSDGPRYECQFVLPTASPPPAGRRFYFAGWPRSPPAMGARRPASRRAGRRCARRRRTAPPAGRRSPWTRGG